MANLKIDTKKGESVVGIGATIEAILTAVSRFFKQPKLPYSTINWEKANGIRY